VEEDFIVMIIGSAVLLLIIGGIAAAFDYASCNSKASAMHVEKTWGPLQGCIVKYRGAYVPIDNIGVRHMDEVQ
jgi:hypothetical protein